MLFFGQIQFDKMVSVGSINTDQRCLMNEKRKTGMDMLRCVAFACVIAVHFFKNGEFEAEIVTGFPMYLMVLLRTGCSICVPLFLTLTGALMSRKKLSRQYYGKIGRTLGIYLLASFACVTYRAAFMRDTFSAKIALVGLFDFSAAPYGWYIEMYLGLFLLIPFLNLIYNHLESRRQKRALLATMLALTALPGIVNVHRVFDLQWWAEPASSSLYYKFMPAWWTGIYPLTYYFIGCYLDEYPLEMERWKNGVLCVLTVLLAGTYNFYRSRGGTYIAGAWQDYGAVSTTALTVLVFNLVTRWDYEGLSGKAKKRLRRMSGWCLGAYLVSWIFDQVFYGMMNAAIPVTQDRIRYFVPVVLAVCVCSLGLSAVLNGGYDWLTGLWRKARENVR